MKTEVISHANAQIRGMVYARLPYLVTVAGFRASSTIQLHIFFDRGTTSPC